MKKLVIGMASLFAMVLHSDIASANTDIKIIVDGAIQQYDQAPILKNDTTFIPIRGVATATGSEVLWEQNTKQITLTKESSVINFTLGSLQGLVNGALISMPESYIAESNRTMVPLRFASEKLGLTVRWEQTTQTIYIDSPPPPPPPPVVPIEEPVSVPVMETTDSAITLASAIAKNGEAYIGTPYLYGASDKITSFFDCSSYTKRIYGEAGITLPRTSIDQSKVGTRVYRNELKKGDLIFFDTAGKGSISHVSVYIDANTLLHATTSLGVSYTTFSKYWQDRYISATRVIKN